MKIDEISGNTGYLFLLVNGFNFNKVRENYILARKLISTTHRQLDRLPITEINRRKKLIDEIQEEIKICSDINTSLSIDKFETNEDLKVLNIKLWGKEKYQKLIDERKSKNI